METARFSDPPNDDPFVNYLKALSVQRPPDLVVTIGGAAARFAQTHRDRLFPSTPLLVTAVEERRLQADALTANDAVLPLQLDLRAVIKNILHVLPETTKVFVVMGSSPLEKFWRQELAEAFEQFEDRLAFEWSDGLPFDEILRRTAALPSGAVVLYGLLVVDAEGVPLEEERALARLHAATSRPVFGLFDSQVGEGIVGGPLLPIDDLASEAADIALRILDGESPGGIVAPARGPSAPVFDKRELDLWGISESRLPHRSIVLFREPTIWQKYRWPIIGVVLLCLIETAFIVALLEHRRRLRRAEGAARELSGRLINVHEEERSRLARELHDDVTQRLAVLAIDAGRGERNATTRADSAAMHDIREELVRLSADVHSLSYQLHPSILEDLGLADALQAECDRFARLEQIPVEVDAEEIPDSLSPEVALGLFRVTQEALRNIGRHAGAARVRVSVRQKHGRLHLSVKDDGSGFDAGALRVRPSLGLASMRQRIELIGGKLAIETARNQGTTILAWVPLQEENHEQTTRAVG